MSAITFDTHKFVKQLQSKGISEEQSEAIVEVMIGVQQSASAKNINKPEFEQFKSELSKDFIKLDNKIDLVEQRLRSEINLLKYGIGYLIAAITGLVIKTIFFA